MLLHQNVEKNRNIYTANKFLKNVATFKYLGRQEQIKITLMMKLISGDVYCSSDQNSLSSRFLSENVNVIKKLPVVLCGCKTCLSSEWKKIYILRLFET
jgi:hypothetical protein